MALNNFVKSIRNIMRNDAGINGDAQRIEQIAWMLFLKVYDEKENDWEFDEDNYKSFIPENCRWRNWAKDNGEGEAITGDALLDFVNNTLFPTLKGLEVNPSTPMRSAIVRTTFEDANQYMKDGVLLRQVINVIDQLDLGNYEESHAFGEIYESILREMQSAGSAGEFYTPRALTDFMAEIIDPKVGEKMADFACGTGGFLTSWLKALDKKVRTAEDKEEYENSIYGIEKKQFPYMLCVTNMLLHDIDSPRVMHDNSLTKDVLNYTDEDKFDVILMNPPYGGSEKNDIKQHFPSDLSSSETADLFMVLIMYRLAEKGRAAVILPDGFLFGADNAKLAIKEKLLREFNLHTIIRLPGSILHLTHQLPPTSFSSIKKRQKAQKRDLARKKHGSIVLTCQKAINISLRQSPCELNIVSQSSTGGLIDKRLWMQRTTMRNHAVLLRSSFLTWIVTSTNASSQRTKKKFFLLQNSSPTTSRSARLSTTR